MENGCFRLCTRISLFAFLLLTACIVNAAPRVILISLDGATPRLVEQYTQSGALNPAEGLGLLENSGIKAFQNVTILPSLTAPGHIAIATGNSAAKNDINANSFHLLVSPFTSNISGFGAPIGGYLLDGPAEAATPTAEPLWIRLRADGKVVITATWPGGDGIDVLVPGLQGSPVIQSAQKRTVDFTLPFGAFAGQGARGFSLTTGDFSAAPAETVSQLLAAGHISFSQIQQKSTALESFTIGGVNYTIQVATLDTTNDSAVNYDTLVFFDQNGIQPGPFQLPSTGPAYVKPSEQKSSLFYFEGSSNKAGTGFYVSKLEPDLSIVRIGRYSANAIPRNQAVLDDVDDINNHVGFWAPQPDFRIPERLSPGFTTFPDEELEAMYEDLVRTFTDYQTRLALRAIAQHPNADLVMIYFEQPDGSGHQFLLTDLRQPTDFTNPDSIGSGQDPAKIARYNSYLETAYVVANTAIQNVIEAVGIRPDGRPKSNIIVTSDHGFEAFHTAVNMNNLLTSAGIDLSKVRAVTSGPAVNIYINLIGREPNGIVTPSEFVQLQQQIVDLLELSNDTNQIYTLSAPFVPLFDKIYARPIPPDLDDPDFGKGTSAFIGQDSGDVFAILTPGYNFDGTQNPVVIRSGDPTPNPASSAVLSVPNFYGAHGYDPELPNLSSIFYAAGPDIRKGILTKVRNIDIAPTISAILKVVPADTAEGNALPIRIPRKIKTGIVNDILDLLPGENIKDSLRILRAALHSARSLAFNLWEDDSHLTSRGRTVFNEDKDAAKELQRLDYPSPESEEVLLAITDADAQLALIALDEAVAEGGNENDINQAREEIAEAIEDTDDGRFDLAIQHYRQAWVLARRAM